MRIHVNDQCEKCMSFERCKHAMCVCVLLHLEWVMITILININKSWNIFQCNMFICAFFFQLQMNHREILSFGKKNHTQSFSSWIGVASIHSFSICGQAFAWFNDGKAFWPSLVYASMQCNHNGITNNILMEFHEMKYEKQRIRGGVHSANTMAKVEEKITLITCDCRSYYRCCWWIPKAMPAFSHSNSIPFHSEHCYHYIFTLLPWFWFRWRQPYDWMGFLSFCSSFST